MALSVAKLAVLEIRERLTKIIANIKLNAFLVAFSDCYYLA